MTTDKLAEAYAALLALLRLFCEDGHAEHRETIAAVRLLAAAGVVDIVKDAAGLSWRRAVAVG